MADLLPCPWCGSPELRSIRPKGTRLNWYVVCLNCQKGVVADDGDTSWNALPRQPQWTEYDGSEKTLPPEGASVIICVGGITQKAHVCRFEDSSWDFGDDIDLLPIKIGDRWIPWPTTGGGE